MSQHGDKRQWLDLLDSQVPDILELIFEAWQAMPPIASDAREDPVSEELCRQLKAAPKRCDLPLQIHTQFVELENAADQEQGRIDIVFFPLVPRESIYFALECKRINVTDKNGKIRPYFAEYVKFGMLRFVKGKYSLEVPHGGMLAFVLDGNIASAISGVESNIASNKVELLTNEDKLMPSSLFPVKIELRESRHTRRTPSPPIVLHHFFMAVAIQQNTTDAT